MEAVVTFLFVGVGVVVAGLGVPLMLKKVPPNRLYGLRTPTTLRNEDVWYEANQITGRFLAVLGVATALLAALLWFVPVVSQRTGAIVCVTFLLTGLAITGVKAGLVTHRLGKRPPGRNA